MGSGGKEKKGDVTVEGEAAPEGPSYEEKLRWVLASCTSLYSWNEKLRDNQTCCSRFVSVIAKPMASKKLAKKVYKVRFTLAHNQFDQNIGHMSVP